MNLSSIAGSPRVTNPFGLEREQLSLGNAQVVEAGASRNTGPDTVNFSRQALEQYSALQGRANGVGEGEAEHLAAQNVLPGATARGRTFGARGLGAYQQAQQMF